MMSRKLLLLTVLLVCVCSCAQAKPERVGVLAPIGQDEHDVIRWSENIAQVEGKTRMFRNTNTLVIYEDLNSMIMALKAGQIDRFAIGIYSAKYIAARDKDFEAVNNPNNAVLGFALGVRKDERVKLIAINRAINDMRKDGTLERLIREQILELGTDDPKAAELPKFDDAETMKVAITGDLPPMDCILADGTPAGFNTAFLAELGRRTHTNIELVSVHAGARQTAITSGRVDAVFWTRNAYSLKRELLPYPLDKIAGVALSEPYLLEARAAVSMKKD